MVSPKPTLREDAEAPRPQGKGEAGLGLAFTTTKILHIIANVYWLDFYMMCTGCSAKVVQVVAEPPLW